MQTIATAGSVVICAECTRNEPRASTIKTFQNKSMTEKKKNGRCWWMATEHNKKASILVSHEPLFQAHQLLALLASPFPMGKNEFFSSNFTCLKKPKTQAEFRCVIPLLPRSLFIQSPIKGRSFWGKHILKGALISCTSRLPKACYEGSSCIVHFKM